MRESGEFRRTDCWLAAFSAVSQQSGGRACSEDNSAGAAALDKGCREEVNLLEESVDVVGQRFLSNGVIHDNILHPDA